MDKATGIVMQMPQRCLGCRYCMTACPYHARYFNWWDPAWPAGMEKSLNPGVAVRMRGVVEKCNLCHARLHSAKEKAAAAGKREIDPADYVPACVEACPTGAIRFGNLADTNDPVAREARSPDAFRLLARIGTEPKVYYKSKEAWVRALAESKSGPVRKRRRRRNMASSVLTDSRWIARGEERTSLSRFLLWLAPWAVVLAVGIYAAGLCLYYGLNQTNMDNRFAFGLWIFLDLAIIALGAGAFFTGFLVYILKRAELRPILNTAVVVGFICYSGAVAILMIDVGQPLRAWFTFWHPNTHSMLTEVTFCISCYLLVLSLEYIPILLRNRQLRKLPSFLVFEHQLHKLVPVLAGVGTLLSFFHQGSLGGLYGVLRGRPFAFRTGLFIWPSTFFLFILSAIASGPSFLMLVTATVEKVTGRRLVPQEVFRRLGFISGVLLAIYVAAKSIDTLIWLNFTSPSVGFAPWQFYIHKPFGTPILFAEIVLFGLVPAFLLTYRRDCGTARMAAECCRPGLCGSAAEPLRADRPDSGFADAGFRRVPAVHAELAGGGELRGRDRLRSDRLFLVVSLSAAVCAAQKERDAMFPGIDGFHWTVGHIVFLSLFFAVVLTIVATVALRGMAHGSRFPHQSARSSCAGSRTLRSCRNRNAAAATNLREG